MQNLDQLEGLKELAGGAEAGELQDLLNLMQGENRVPGLDASKLTLRLIIKEPAVRFAADGRIAVGGFLAVLFWR